jgi:hypothetical protein
MSFNSFVRDRKGILHEGARGGHAAGFERRDVWTQGFQEFG